MRRVAVLGGGIAGLSAALACQRAGLSVTVFEAAPAVGGLAGGAEVFGQTADLGSHRLHSALDAELRGELEALLARFGGGPLLERPRRGGILFEGQLLRFPLSPAELLWRLGPRFALRCALERRPDPGRDFASAVAAELGPTLLARFYRPYAEKVWGRPAEELSAELARRRATGGRGLWSKLRDSASARKRRFLYPKGGFAAIPRALAAAAREAGAALRLEARVTGLVRRGAAWRIEWQGAGESGSVEAELIVATIPLPALVRALRLEDAPALEARAATLELRPLTLLFVEHGDVGWSAREAFYIPERGCPVARLSQPGLYRGEPWPLLTYELPGALDGEPLELARAIQRNLRGRGLEAPEPLRAERRLVPGAWPIPTPAAEAARAAIHARLAALPGLILLGRQASFLQDNAHQLLAWGRALPAALAGAEVDRAALAALEAAYRSAPIED